MNIIDKIKAPFTKLFIDRMTEKAVSQDEFGYKKYGQYLDPMDSYDWLNMATEEYVDLGKYLEAERHKRDVIITSMIKNINLARILHEDDIDINNLLDSLEKDINRLSKNLDGMEQGKASK